MTGQDSPAGVARLEVQQPLEQERVVAIDRTPFTIGRRQQSDLALDSAAVSRDHAEIVHGRGGHLIRDRGSRNGTFVNGMSVEERGLQHGDQIRIGDVEMLFLTGVSEGPPPASPRVIGAELRQAARLLEGLRALGSARALDEVLELVLDSALALTGAERGFIMLAETGGGLAFKLGRDRHRRTLPGLSFETSRKVPEQVFATRQPRVVADLRDESVASAHAATVALGIRNLMAVPLVPVRYSDTAAAGEAGRQEAIGVLYLDSREPGALQSLTTLAGLETLAAEAAVAIDSARLYRESQERAQIERDLHLAKEVQQALLPRAAPERDFFTAAAAAAPCLAIGGDFFEYVDFADGSVGFALGDIAGKGVSAGLLGARVQESLARLAHIHRSPAATIRRVNESLVGRHLEARFVTLFFGVLAPDGRLAYCNAGHNPPVLLQGDRVRRLDRGGLIVGPFPEANYEEGWEQMEPGDVLVTFTDGVSEAVGSGGMYGEGRVVDCIVSARRDNGAPGALVSALFASVRQFTAGHPQTDDMTVLVVCYRGSHHGTDAAPPEPAAS